MLGLKAKIIAAGIFLLGILAFIAKVFLAGRAAERARQAQATLRNIKEARDAQDRVDALPDDAVARELRDKWGRR